MTTVIIGGGSRLRAALQALEAASLSMSEAQRNQAEKLLAEQADQLDAMLSNSSRA